MSDEMKVQARGFNKRFLVIAIVLVVIGLIAALVLLLPTSAKAKKVEEQLNLGAKYLSELDYEQAIVAYEAVIKIDPKCEEAYLALADIYIVTGAFDKAEEILKRAEEAIGFGATSAVANKKIVVEGGKEAQMQTEVPTGTSVPSPTKLPTPTVTPSPTPTTHTIYDGTTVELSKANVGDVVLFGSYEQDNIDSNGAEAILWYVLDREGDKLLLMSVYLLDCVPYHKKWEAITWEDCTLRQWMNDDFYNRAFTKSEMKYILTSYLQNADNPYYGTEGGNDTEDKVFALSLQEAEQYFGIEGDGGYWDSDSASTELSAAKVTAYAEARGVNMSDNTGFWWLRSPADDYYHAVNADYDGDIWLDGIREDYEYSAARPALWLNLNSTATPSPTPTATPSPTPTSTPTPTATPSPIPTSTPTPTATPVPAAHTIYDGTTVELSEAKVGDVVLFGTYEQDNIDSNGAEAIPWYVLDKDGDKLLLVSVYLLDAVPYHEKYISSTWEDCTLRQWMNDDFYNRAFTKSEKKYIQTSCLKNEDNPYYGTEGGNDTEDKVFALSLQEAEQYFGIAEDDGYWWYSASPELSAAKVTTYADAQGAYVNSGKSTAGNGCWWLRSPGYIHYTNPAYVRYDGVVYVNGNGVVLDGGAARPALWLNLNP